MKRSPGALLGPTVLFLSALFLLSCRREPKPGESPPEVPVARLRAGTHGSDARPACLPEDAFEPGDPQALLRRNGFVVEIGACRQMFEPYLDADRPFFVTADSAFYTFHFLFEKCLKLLEFENAARLRAFVRAMHGATARLPLPRISSVRRARPACLALFEVAAGLLGESLPSLSGRRAAVTEEVRRIRSAGLVARSVLLRQRTNYDRFRPDGFYAGLPSLERYYRARRWLGAKLFRTEGAEDTAAALLLAEAFAASPEASRRWKELDELWGWLVGPVDDLTLAEYARAASRLGRGPFSSFTEAEVRRFAAIVRRMRKPRIRQGLGDDTRPEQGLRILGTRYLPESELFWRTSEPHFPRTFHTGLDVVSLMGSGRGLDLMGASPALRERTGAVVAEIRRQPGGAFYRGMLDGLGRMIRGGSGPAPPFMETEAWKDRSVNSALACWALLRHSFSLQAKVTTSYGCVHPPPSGFVEPFPAFFAFLRENAARLRLLVEKPQSPEAARALAGEVEALKKRIQPRLGRLRDKRDAPRDLVLAITHANDLLSGPRGVARRLERFESLMQAVEAEAEAERHGRTLGLDEVSAYGSILQELHGYDATDRAFEDDMPKTCVACEYQRPGRALQVGIGRANRLFVLYPWQGGLVPCQGAVLSYREFLRPLSSKLDDADWQARVGPMTARPAWNRSFTGKEVDPAVLPGIASEPEVRRRFLRK